MRAARRRPHVRRTRARARSPLSRAGADPRRGVPRLAVGELVVFLGHSFFARESGYTLQFAGGPRQWFELRLSDDDPRDSALLGSLHCYLAPA